MEWWCYPATEAVNAGLAAAPEDDYCLACELDGVVAGAYSVGPGPPMDNSWTTAVPHTIVVESSFQLRLRLQI